MNNQSQGYVEIHHPYTIVYHKLSVHPHFEETVNRELQIVDFYIHLQHTLAFQNYNYPYGYEQNHHFYEYELHNQNISYHIELQ